MYKNLIPNFPYCKYGLGMFHLLYSHFFQCLKYQTDQLQDVKKLEKLNNVLMRHMVAK